MRAGYVQTPDPGRPLDALVVGDRPDPEPPPGWSVVTVAAASLNHHDVFSLSGVGLLADRCPMILGTDAAGYDAAGNPVVVYGVITDPAWRGDETLDPSRTLLSELHQGTFAESVIVPDRNVIRLPAGIDLHDAACLGTAWLTAYRMLFVKSGLRAGDRVLIQGASGGVSSAAIALARVGGYGVFVTGRSEAKRRLALDLGAHEVFESGARLPVKVDAVLETVGAATWEHSLRSLRPGGTIVVSGSTTGPNPGAGLNRIFFQQMSVVGSTMGTRDELQALLRLLQTSGIRPRIAQVLPLDRAREGLAAMIGGDTAGKIVVDLS